MAMDHQRPSDVSDTYTIGDIRDSRGIAIGSNNAIYNYFLDGRYRPLAEHIISFDWLIDQAREFVGRAFLLDQLDAFLAQYAQGYIVLTGEPGIGKTAFLAWLVHERHYPHHFNIALQGIRSPEQFLENICAQLIMRYKLDLAFLPLTVGRDGSFLNSLLYRISEKLRGTEEAIVLVVDAIDEVTVVEGANILYLPPTLPGRVYFVLSARVFPRQLSIATDYRAVVIDAAAPEHIHDLRIYLHRAATDPRLAAILTDSA